MQKPSRKQIKNAHKHPDLQDALGGSRTFTVAQAPNGPFGVAALNEEIRTHSRRFASIRNEKSLPAAEADS